jgi:hypothetical protein
VIAWNLLFKNTHDGRNATITEMINTSPVIKLMPNDTISYMVGSPDTYVIYYGEDRKYQVVRVTSSNPIQFALSARTTAPPRTPP